MQRLTEINIEYRNKVLSLIDNICNSIIELPTNDKVKRISSKIQIINFKDLDSRNWSPEYYNFEWQYKEVAKDIQNCNILKLESYISNLVTNGTIKRYNKDYKLNPTVVENIKNCLK